MKHKTNGRARLILILGAMTALSPFSIDMYLPAFQGIADDFRTTVAEVSLSLSSYFVGLAIGQLIYGPLLDRYGRKRPLLVGLVVYVLASLLCAVSGSTGVLIAWRFVEAFGGCAAGVAAMAMVRDLFEVKDSAKVFSLLILILGASPLLAPTAGGYLADGFGWHSVFIVLAVMGCLLFAAVKFGLPESHEPDPGVELRPLPIFRNFVEILRDPVFATYAFAGAIAFSGLFVYLAGSPLIFLGKFGVSGRVYGWIFATVAAGMIGASQVNVWLLRRFGNETLLRASLIGQVVIGAVFTTGTVLNVVGLPLSIFLFFLFMCCFGIANPNAGALAMAPFARNAGRASALLGFLQMGVGAIASMCVGVFGVSEMSTVVLLMTGTSLLAVLILVFGERTIRAKTFDAAKSA